MSPPWHSTPCPVCGTPFARLAFGGQSKAGHVFPACDRCGHAVAWKDGLVVADYDEYGEGYVCPDELLPRRLAEVRATVAPFLRMAPPAPRCLEVGAGGGFFAAVAAEAGWRVTAFEPSRLLRRFGEERFGIGYVTDLAEAPGPFDVVMLLDVIEHVHPLRVAELLDDLRGKLRPGGQLMGITPNLSSLNLRLGTVHDPAVTPPGHAAHFTPRSLRMCLAGRGFEIERVWTAGFHTAAFFERWPRLRFLHQPWQEMSRRRRALALPFKAGGRLVNRLLPETSDLGYILAFVARRPSVDAPQNP